MKKIVLVIFMTVALFSFAEEGFDDFGDFEEFATEETKEDEGFETAEEKEPELKISGALKYEARAYVIEPRNVTSHPELDLDLNYENKSSSIYANINIKDDGELDLKEAYLRLNYDKFKL